MKQIDLMSILEAPVVSEKSTRNAEKENRVVFRVKRTATKQQVKRAVELLFKVEVDSVHVLNVKGKAYIKLKPGFDIDFSAA